MDAAQPADAGEFIVRKIPGIGTGYLRVLECHVVTDGLSVISAVGRPSFIPIISHEHHIRDFNSTGRREIAHRVMNQRIINHQYSCFAGEHSGGGVIRGAKIQT